MLRVEVLLDRVLRVEELLEDVLGVLLGIVEVVLSHEVVV